MIAWLKKICAWALRAVTAAPKKNPSSKPQTYQHTQPRRIRTPLRMKSEADLAALEAAQEKRDRKNAKRRGASQ